MSFPRTERAEKAIAGEVIPADVMEAASKVADEALDDMSWNGCRDAVARAIMAATEAERERCAQIADAHRDQCLSKIKRKRSDHALAVFESAASEASSIADTIRLSTPNQETRP